jgi:hypothetical protein
MAVPGRFVGLVLLLLKLLDHPFVVAAAAACEGLEGLDAAPKELFVVAVCPAPLKVGRGITAVTPFPGWFCKSSRCKCSTGTANSNTWKLKRGVTRRATMQHNGGMKHIADLNDVTWTAGPAAEAPGAHTSGYTASCNCSTAVKP